MPYGFDYYARVFASHGICSIGIDQRGYGRSGGIRGYTQSFEEVGDDLVSFLRAARQKEPRLAPVPVFLMGHSMGGLGCALTALRYPGLARGVVMFSPPFEPVVSVQEMNRGG